MRKFEIISASQWEKDITSENYDEQCPLKSHIKPYRGTKHSAGYDFTSPIGIVVPARGMALIPTGVKAQMNEDEVLEANAALDIVNQQVKSQIKK